MTDQVRKLMDDALAAAPGLANSDGEFLTAFFNAVEQMEVHYKDVDLQRYMVLASVPLKNFTRLKTILREKGVL